MSQQPYMKLWVSDFLGDTLHLTQAEVGQYLLILMAMWNAGGSVPASKLRCIARGKVSPEVMSFFDISDGTVTNKRLSSEVEKAHQLSEVARSNADAKHRKYKEGPYADAPAERVPNDCYHSHSHITDTESERITKSVGAKAPATGWSGSVVRLNAKDFAEWSKAYSRLDLPAELLAYDQYLVQQGVTKAWFARTSKYLANRNMEAKAKGEVMAKPPPVRQSRTVVELDAFVEEVRIKNGTSRSGICVEGGEHAHPQLPDTTERSADLCEPADDTVYRKAASSFAWDG